MVYPHRLGEWATRCRVVQLPKGQEQVGCRLVVRLAQGSLSLSSGGKVEDRLQPYA